MLIQNCFWPGVDGVASCQGTISHGITPSTFVLTTYPQAARPQAAGRLAFTDGTNLVALQGCKLASMTGRAGPDGQTWVLTILDRRWRWRSQYGGLGAIDGNYNRQDKRGKLVPWTIRSPVELAGYCLDMMGEVGYAVDLPTGLSRRDGADLDRYLLAGQFFGQSAANPRTFWDRTPPAEALARLCDYFGRRVVFQPLADRVIIAQLGIGGHLPGGGVEVDAPGVVDTGIPSVVGVAGTARFQMRFSLEAVGKEWDGKFIPINDLSYTPKITPAVQISTVTMVASPPPSGYTLQLTITWLTGLVPSSVVVSGSSADLARVWSVILDEIRANAQLNDLLTASLAGNVLTLTGRQGGKSFNVGITVGEPTFAGKIVQPAGPPWGRGWNNSPPPSRGGVGFPGVLPTDRLSYVEAQQLARDSVWRCYRIKNVKYGTEDPPIVVPWYGPVRRRQQILLEPSKVEQVAPAPPNVDGIQRGGPVRVLADYYNGYSQDAQGVVFGSVCANIGSVLWNVPNGDPNTSPFQRIYVRFSVDQEEQMIVFEDYVYALVGGEFVEPKLTLETGCMVEDPNTNQVVRWFYTAPIGGPAPAEWLVREDLGVGIIGRYANNGDMTGFDFQDLEDAKFRAKYYLTGMGAKFQLPVSLTRQYPGILPIDPDGAIQQVTWSVGPAGPTTTASLNMEHLAYLPDYSARRRAENLSPNKAAALANQTDPFGRLGVRI